jgi:hypothetical protein
LVRLLNLSDENFLNEAEKFNNHPLNRKDDVQQLVSAAVNLRREYEFHELIFTAKYIRGLLRIVNKAPGIPEVENIDYVRSDILENMKKIIDQLRKIVSDTEPGTVKFFEKNYLLLNQDSFKNLNLLLADLESVKKYLNHLKHSH